MKIFLEIAYNFGVLIAISIISGFISEKFQNKKIKENIIQGIFFGVASIVGMLNPVVLGKGLIFDGRSVMISLAGIFFGTISSLIAAIMAGILRIYQGGSGVRMGVLVVICSAVIGILFNKILKKYNKKIDLNVVFFLGLMVHIAMLMCTIALPKEVRLNILKNIWFPVIIIYPLATLIIGKVLINVRGHIESIKELREREIQIRSISNNFKKGMIYQIIKYKNGERKFTYLSNSVKEMYGVSPEEAMKDSSLIYSKIYEEDIERVKKAEEYSEKNFSDFNCEVRFYLGKNKLRWSKLVSTPTLIENGEAIRWDGIDFDITDQKIIEEELKIEKDKAEAANKSKSQFLANMSHEIRTPMNGIIGMTDLLSFTTVDEEQKFFIENIKESADKLLNIINDILDISKIEAGKIKIEEKEFELKKMVESTISVMLYMKKEKNIIIKSEIDKEIPLILIGDEGKIRQILLNLVTNAVKFTEKGEISIKINKMEEIGNLLKLKFSVSDTGIGISESIKKDIFKPFIQGDLSYSKKYQGTGLGLAICRNLTELMGGYIDMESEEGKGTKFEFILTLKFNLEKNS